MAAHHCPYCNAQNTAAIGAVAFGGRAVVEHRCGYCGRLFCIGDRRFTAVQSEITGAGATVKSNEKSFRAAQSESLTARGKKLQ